MLRGPTDKFVSAMQRLADYVRQQSGRERETQPTDIMRALEAINWDTGRGQLDQLQDEYLFDTDSPSPPLYADADADLEDGHLQDFGELNIEDGSGVCVVRAVERDDGGQQFELDEAALAAVLRRRGLADRPAVLLSVAGALRGGKSFLLDFFLRYLYAEESARADGSWLGAPDEPLRGFSWRPGCALETQGLVLWSQPFPVTLPDGQEVAVLLMDTQGAFDDQSSFRDCSLIFALSTLLSSVQVYNLSQRINESDLQHLQVFTEHAAAGGGALPALQLLVRDWSAPGDFPAGAGGGADYLRHKLQVREEQPRELREVRARLAGSFERLACYLLPHPGLRAAADPAFRGHLAELTVDFRDSLRDLVPLLLAPERLCVKKVDGRPLRVRHLAVHLRAYLDTFRHAVPSPQSFARAQATARWVSAAADARARLRWHAPALPAPATGRAALRTRLAAARRAALQPLVELAARAGNEAGLAGIEKELDEQMAQLIYVNEAKIALGVGEAKEEWERQARALRDPALCAPARDVREDAAAALAAAAACYDRAVADPQEPDRAKLIQELEARGEQLVAVACAVSERNHAAATRAALAALRESLPRAAADSALHPADVAAAHAAAAESARAVLRAARSRPARHDPDPYLTSLNEQIAVILREHAAQNVAANELVVAIALRVYAEAMAPGPRCLHPAELAAAHERVRLLAARELRARRPRLGPRAADRTDVYEEQLETNIQEHYRKYVLANDISNEVAVQEAYRVFLDHMVAASGLLQLSDADMAASIEAAEAAAKGALCERRLSAARFGIDDKHFNRLEQIMRGGGESHRECNSKKLSVKNLVQAGAVVGGCAAVATAGPLAAVTAAGVAGVVAVGLTVKIVRSRNPTARQQ